MTTSDSNYEIYDKTTGESLVGFHDAVRIYDFGRDDRPCQLRLTMAGAIAVLDRIAANTGRKLGVREI